MSALVALVGPPRVVRDDDAARMVRALERRGANVREWRSGGVYLGTRRFPWEDEAAGATHACLAVTPRVVVAADASLYYVADLRTALERRNVRPPGASPAELIAASYEAWGDECLLHLEGDFAFALWDLGERRLLLGRDFLGRRALHVAEIGGGVIAATAANAVIAHGACPARFDLDVLAAAACGFIGGGEETAFEGVRAVPAGVALSWSAEQGLREATRWLPPGFAYEGKGSPDDAAVELRGLVERAVAERIPPRGDAVVWMSGGWDSTSVFAAGRSALSHGGDPRRLRIVSLTYPEGDDAREDHFIRDVAERWETNVEWIDAESVSLFEGMAERAGRRDDPFAHLFEESQRSLARRSVASGARVILDGYGGDQLFQVSDVVLADDLRHGHWLALARKWRGRRDHGARAFVRLCIQPLLPEPLLALLEGARGRPIARRLRQDPPSWIRHREGLEMRRRLDRGVGRRCGEGAAAYETRAILEAPFMANAQSWVYAFALEEGAEMRAPLYDRRLMEFAARRPASERYSGSETKILLRRAMGGLIPESVLAPRRRKTGMPIEYLRRQMSAALAPALAAVFGDERTSRPVLEVLGLVNSAALAANVQRYVADQDHATGVQLYLTLQTELWLRSQIPILESPG